jgi:predicted RNA-binding Zn ribbon-like protein
MGDWVWDGGRLSIDLLNTVRDRARSPRETLRTPADLAVWLREANLPHGEDAVGEDALIAARRLRAAIDALSGVSPAEGPAGGVAIPAAAALVNATAADAPTGPRLALDGGRPVAVPPEPSVAAALGRIALDAIDLLTGGERMRVCAADDCGIRFADRSPAQNRQWCSMRRCGNRSKARRHYTRTTT